MLLKYVALAFLVLETTAMIVTLRYTRTVKQDGPRYLSSTVVMLGEVFKLAACLAVIAWQKGSINGVVTEINKEIFQKPTDCLKISIPSGVYAFQNNILFLALSYLDAATYQVTYQLKILSSALFSVGLLGKRLTAIQWVSLFLLMSGVALVQIPAESEKDEERRNHWIGVVAILISSLSSGFAGVYFEKILKESTVNLWIRNCEMAFFGIIFSGFGAYISDHEPINKNGFFQGYTNVVWFLIVLHAFGGLLVSTVIKYMDNIIKGFAASLSIVLSSILSYLYFPDFYLTRYFLFGASMVIGASIMYSYTGAKSKQTKER